MKDFLLLFVLLLFMRPVVGQPSQRPTPVPQNTTKKWVASGLVRLVRLAAGLSCGPSVGVR